MNRTTRIGTGLGVGAVAFAAAAVMAVASPATSVAAADGATTAPSATSAPAEGCQGMGKELLTGDDAVQATAAAQAAVEGGTVLRVTVDPDGDYEAHVRNSEGTVVEVTMDDSFSVTGVEELPARGSGGGRGGPHGPGMGKELLTGDDAVQATAAAQAAVEGGTVLRVTVDPDGDYEAHVRNSEGTVVEVTMDDSFSVTGVEELPARGSGGGRGGPRGHGGGPDSSDADEDGANAEGTASQTMAA